MLLNITDLLAPKINTHVINIVIPNAIKSGGRPIIPLQFCFECAVDRREKLKKIVMMRMNL